MTRSRSMLPVLILALLCAFIPARADGPGVSERAPTDGVSKHVASRLTEVPVHVRTKIDPRVLKQLMDADEDALARQEPGPQPVTFLVHLREKAKLDELNHIPSTKARHRTLMSILKNTAERTQRGIVAYLDERIMAKKVTRYKGFWIFNGLAVDGDLETAIRLAERPDVESIRPNRVHHLPQPRVPQGDNTPSGDPERNIASVRADQVWSSYGITGEGVVVANLDSGVDFTHPALLQQYRGYNPVNPGLVVHDYNWFDPTGTYPDAPGPNHPNISVYSDHGTHTMGTLVGSEPDGSNSIGVAPGAKWIAVKVFDDEGEATDEWIHAGFQWCLAPTDLNGENPDPSKAPAIVSNSWGDDNGLDLTFQQDLLAWRAAGIFSSWAAGNAGPDPATVGSPASFSEALAVGAVDAQRAVASFSSRGPSPWGETKPEVVAPGVNIRSAIAGGLYEGGWNGTSMATPHVAGLAALMRQANQTLTITATRYVITSTAVDLAPLGDDNDTGFGLIDAYQAVGAVYGGGTFAGRVTDASTDLPIEAASIVMQNLAGGQVTTVTEGDGSYSFSVAQGFYDVTASRFGYHDSTARSIEIRARTLTQVDFALVPSASGTIRGRVTRAVDGQPVAAVVSLPGTPAETGTDTQGHYALTVPVGTYTVRALPEGPGHRGAEAVGVEVTAGGVITSDFQLTSIPRALLVDADAWSYGGTTIQYYQQALASLLYGHDTHLIRDPPTDNPSAGQLAEYDIVIWSHPLASPGYIGAWTDLGAYLDQGGGLLISGQDIGYWDSEQGSAPDAYSQYLHAAYVADNGGFQPLIGVSEGPLQGIDFSFNTADSARNQQNPDVIEHVDHIGRDTVAYLSGHVAGLHSDACTHRVVYLGFGLEGMGPASARQQAILKAVDWLVAERPEADVRLSPSATSQGTTLGSTASYDLAIVNEGRSEGAYEISVEPSMWPARLIDPGSMQVIAHTDVLAPCEKADLRLEVAVPGSAPTNWIEDTQIRVTSVVSPDVSASQTIQTVAFHPWVESVSLPTPRYRLACAATDCALYAIGGYDEYGDETDTVEILSLVTGSWAAGTPKPTPAANSAVAELGGLIYVIGGYVPGAQEYVDAVEIYQPSTDTWAAAAPLPVPLSGMAATAFAGKVYAFGGNGLQGESNAGYVYDVATDVWSELASLPTSNASFGKAIELNESIYLAGGWPNRDQVLRYDPAADSWEILKAMRVGRHSFAMVSDGHHVVVAGGGDEWTGLRAVERYDPDTNSWTDLPDLRSGDRAGTSGAYLDGRLYVVGGTGQTTTSSVEYLDIQSPLCGSYLGVDATLAKPGDTLAYSLLVRNPSGGDVPTSWSHSVPAEAEYVEGSSVGGAVYDEHTRMLRWSGQVSSYEVRSFSFLSTVGAAVPDEAVITATVHLDGGGCVAHELVATTVVFTPSLNRSTKGVDRTEVAPGERLCYTILVANGSPFTISNASLVDPVPERATYVPESAIGATYNPDLDRIEWTGTLPPANGGECPFQWIDATGGVDLGLTDDSCAGALDLGFDFEFYGNTYSRISVNSNGMVLFGGCSTSYSNVAIPDPAEPNDFVAPFWDDLRPGWGDGTVYFDTFGIEPNRHAVVEWHSVVVYGQDQPQTYEVVLYEGSNSIVLQYLEMTGERGTGSRATVGIENHDGSEGVQYLYDGEPENHLLHDRLAVELEHSSTYKASTHVVSFEVQIDNPTPPLTSITNRAWIDDGLVLHERAITSTVCSPVLATSTKMAYPSRALSGDTVEYLLRIENTGNYTATDASFIDALPASLAYVPGSLEGEGASYNNALRQVEWQGTVPPESASIEVSYLAVLTDDLPCNTWITNTTTLREGGVAMSTLQAGVLVNEVNLGTSAKAAHEDHVVAGSPVTYTITLRNSGLFAAEHTTMTDRLPSELVLVPGTLAGATYDSESSAIVWQGALPAHEEHIVSFGANVLPNVLNGTMVTNTAVADDGHGATIERHAPVRVLRGDLSPSDMLVDPVRFTPGRPVTYTLRLINSGDVDIGAGLHCTPTAPLYAIPGTAYASTGEVALVTETVTWSGTIVAHGMAIVRFAATVPGGTPPQSLVMRAVLADSGGIDHYLQVPVTVGGGEMQFLPMFYNLLTE